VSSVKHSYRHDDVYFFQIPKEFLKFEIKIFETDSVFEFGAKSFLKLKNQKAEFGAKLV
jgi:hypothetical protein